MSNKKQILHVLKILVFVSALLLAIPEARAEGAKSSGKGSAPTAAASGRAEDNKSDKVDIKDLENQYWAAKDTDFSVVQNRAYTKEHRFALSASGGPLLNDYYNTGNIYQLSANYFWSERYGVQVDAQVTDLKDSKITSDFKDIGGGAAPDYNRLKSSYLVGFNWVPIYAKMSLLSSKIIYFDFAITPMVGTVTYQQQLLNVPGIDKSSFAYGLDISQYFFFARHFAVRTSVRNLWYKQDVLKSTGASKGQPAPGRTGEEATSFQFLLGLTFFF